ncbi:MAG: ATP-dependent nuclease subunit B [Opitutus sp.]|nr:ATP-dependent nuclease subunit B [Opitutus sp.]
MVPVPNDAVVRHFLTWQSPLLPQAVAWLARDWDGVGPLDLSHWLVVVPTRQAGRRLRAGLAEHAAARGQAAFPPRVIPPEALLVSPATSPAIASALESTLAWTHLLRALELDEFRAVFPVDPPARSFAWALRLAQQFQQLQATLGEVALTMPDVAPRAPAGFPERERWQQLGELARRQAAWLASHDRREPQAARLAAARSPAPPEGVERIVLLAVPDPLPLALVALAEHARRTPVDVVVFAPAAEAANFDGWGRPVTDAWQHRAAPFSDFAGQVHLLADATAQAEQVARLAARYDEPDGLLALGIADPEITPLAEAALARAGRAAFDPAGEPRRNSGFFHLLERLAAFAREPSFAHVAALARQPEILGWLHAELGDSFGAATLLAALDELWAAHLPATLTQARAHARGVAGAALAKLDGLRARLRAGDFATAVTDVLQQLFSARHPAASSANEAELADAAEAWMEIVRACADAARAFPELRRDEWWQVALEQFGRARRESDKPLGALELQGWLELLWEDAPHLVVAGCNDGFVPDAVVGDVFLPESLRAHLGLKTNAARFARDAYLLQALVASRCTGGRVDVLLGKISSAGDPLKPSRLLLQCSDDELPARIERLFRPLESGAALPAWERAWQLRPRRAAPPSRVSVTAFRSYLECPFRFYLRHVLQMEAIDPEKSELDAFDFGHLCHAPLEKLKEAPWRDCADENLLAAMLLEGFDALAAATFGAEHTVPLVAQLESARQRLRRAAAVQARERAAGWVVQDVERKFTLDFVGVTVVGKIDRLDRHETTGAWRVIDYKTSDAAKAPFDAHLAAPRRGVIYPEWAIADIGGKPRVWTDLQLPLYLHAVPLLGIGTTDRPACGYFNLPKAIGDTGLALWDGYTPELQDAAMRCAREIIDAIRAEKFWPPNESIRAERDPFAALFQRGVAASVAREESK